MAGLDKVNEILFCGSLLRETSAKPSMWASYLLRSWLLVQRGFSESVLMHLGVHSATIFDLECVRVHMEKDLVAWLVDWLAFCFYCLVQFGRQVLLWGFWFCFMSQGLIL